MAIFSEVASAWISTRFTIAPWLARSSGASAFASALADPMTFVTAFHRGRQFGAGVDVHVVTPAFTVAFQEYSRLIDAVGHPVVGNAFRHATQSGRY